MEMVMTSNKNKKLFTASVLTGLIFTIMLVINPAITTVYAQDTLNGEQVKAKTDSTTYQYGDIITLTIEDHNKGPKKDCCRTQ